MAKYVWAVNFSSGKNHGTKYLWFCREGLFDNIVDEQ